MPRYFPVFFLFLSLATIAQGQLSSKIKADLDDAQKRLLAQRAQQADEKKALSQKLTAAQQELLTKRRQADLGRRSVSDQQAYLENLRNKEYTSSAEVLSLSSGLRSYGLQLFAKQYPGEAKDQRFDPIFKKESDENKSLQERFTILDAGLERLEKALNGGATYQAQVGTEKAELVDGKVLSFGPSLWFQSDDGSLSGRYLLSRSGKVASLDTDVKKTANALFSGEEAKAQIDITGGKARALAEVKSGPIDLVKKGGAWVYPILLLAFAALFCAGKKFFELRRIKDPADESITSLSDQYLSGDSKNALTDLQSMKHPISDVLPATMEAVSDGDVELGEEVLYERLIPVRETLRRWLPFIAVTAAVAPLLGLLGTVSGLIKAFSGIAVEGTGEAQSISGGISEALITTLFGLAVAIPAYMAHALLSRRAKGIEQATERLSLIFLNSVRKQQIQSSS